MSSLFSRLFRYQPSAGRTPTEDFFTEALAGVLQASPSLRLALVKWLIGHDVDSVLLETQKTTEDGNRLDIWIDARERHGGAHHVIAMENKIATGEGQDQLQRYEDCLKRETAADTRTLVYATLHERSAFQVSPEDPLVTFRPIYWFEVADWMRDWTTKPTNTDDDRSTLFVRELLLLMEEWSMAINLNADLLAAATKYQQTVGPQLVQILEETKQACGLAGTKGNSWSHDRAYLNYSSPWLDDREDIYVEFGFDFDRDDADFSVPQLCMPSAYFAVRGTHRPELDNLREWGPAPESWPDGYVCVKRLGCLRLHGTSLHGEYLDFFLNARAELWRAV